MSGAFARCAVYVATRPDGAVKIGVSKDTDFREYSLAAVIPGVAIVESFDVAEPRKVEAFAHALLDHRRLEGEWFSVAPLVAKEAIARAVHGLEAGEPIPASSFRRRRRAFCVANGKAGRGKARKPIDAPAVDYRRMYAIQVTVCDSIERAVLRGEIPA